MTHDLFNKTFKEHDFNYFSEYLKQNHLEQDSDGDKKAFNGILPFFNYDRGNTFADKNEGFYTINQRHQKRYITIMNNPK